jgi:hypothetical protein
MAVRARMLALEVAKKEAEEKEKLKYIGIHQPPAIQLSIYQSIYACNK